MLTNIVYVVVGLVGLTLGGNFLIKGASRLASAMGISALIIGLTVVALGTSAPELIVSLNAALTASSDVALGNIVGSNIANIGLILSIAALITPLTLKWGLLRREIVVVIGASLLLLVFAADGEIGRLDGAVLVAGFVGYVVYVYRQGQRERSEIEPELVEFEEKEQLILPPAKTNTALEVVRVAIGLAALVAGANWMVNGSVAIAREIGVSDLLIGLTLVAVGTSLPEMATSIIAAVRKENDIVLGNVIGSNISNTLFILGVVALVQPIPVAASSTAFDIPVMIGFALLLVPLVFRGTLRGAVAVGIIALYVGYVVFSFLR